MSNETEINLKEILKLFNKRSPSSLSLKDIVFETNIDKKTLSTKFKSIDDITEALYLDFMEKLTRELLVDSLAIKGPEFFAEMIYNTMMIRYDYRFLAREFDSIMNNNPRMRKHYTSNRIKAKQSLLSVFNVWRNMGYLEEEEFIGSYEDLLVRLEMLLEYWPVAANIYVKKGGKEKIITYHRVVANTMLPFLTEKGKKSFVEAMLKFN